MNDPAHNRSVVLLLLAALCWSLGGVLIKWVQWPPLAVASGRGLIATLFLGAACARTLRFTWSPVQLGAAVAYALTTVLFVTATKLTTAANAILIQYTAPVWVALLGAGFLQEHPQRSDWFVMALVFAGMGIFLYDGLHFSGLAGNLFALGSGVAFAALVLLLRKQKDGSPIESIILGNALAFLIGLPWLARAPALPADGWVALGLLGLVQLGVSYLLYARAIKHVTALEAVLIPIIEPILNPLWVMLVLGEKPSQLALFGGAIVIGAVTWRALASIRGPRGAAAPAA
ncbi:MAG: EamA family transporter [Opitutae bacterium]|nr:EamA family transporter [Opitutae bacterium]